MRIGEIAERAGVTTKTVRYYEQLGILPQPERTASGYRTYGDDTLDRLRFIRDAQSTGLNLTEIHSILEMKDQGERSCEHTRDLLARHVHDIDAQMTRLTTARQTLMRLAERADRADPAECTDPHRCQVITGRTADAG